MQRIMISLVWAIVGDIIGIVLGSFLVYAFSNNQHDPFLEAVMTGAFVIGPSVALIFFVFAMMLVGEKQQ